MTSTGLPCESAGLPPLGPRQGTLFQNHRAGKPMTSRDRARVDRQRSSASARARNQRHAFQTYGAGRAVSLFSNVLKRLAEMNGDEAHTEPHDRFVAFTKCGLYLFWDEGRERWTCPFGYNSQFEDVSGWDPQRLLMSG